MAYSMVLQIIDYRHRLLLLSTDGPDHNVIKMKPPLVFSRDDADVLLSNLDVVLGEPLRRQLRGRLR